MNHERLARRVLLFCLSVSIGLCFIPGIEISCYVETLVAGEIRISFMDPGLPGLTGKLVSGVPCGICLFLAVLGLVWRTRRYVPVSRGLGTGFALAAAFKALSAASHLGGGLASNWPLYGITITLLIGCAVYIPVFLWDNAYRGRRVADRRDGND